MNRFPQKRVFITGAGSGFGRALAMEYARRGWRVAVADINAERAEETKAMVDDAGGKGLVLICDVTKEEAIQEAADTLVEKWSGVDIAVNNAGVAAGGYVEKIPQDQWDWIMALNFKSVLYGCRVFIPIMERQGGGQIVNMASAAGFTSLPEMGSYNVTKAAVISLSETLRSELAPKNIGVTVITPTFFKTNLMDQFKCTDERQKRMAQAFFNKSSATAGQVARRAYWAIMKDKFWAVTQTDGKFTFWAKRLFPETYFNMLRFGYKHGLMDRFL